MINVAFCIDDDFAPYMAVSLMSLLANTQSEVSIFVIGNLSDSVKQDLSTLGCKRATIDFVTHNVEIPTSELSDRYQGRLNAITFVRYAIAEILPSLDKVIYLDADILVTDDIAALWAAPLDQQVVGVVEDHSLMSQGRPKTLELISNAYFNAGVMVIDLDKWRERNTFARLLQVHGSQAKWEYNDQDVLNKVLDADSQYLDAKFNAQTYTLNHQLVDSPTIVHFTGQEKPWHISSAHLFTAQYREFYKKVPFSSNKLSLFLDNEDRSILENLNEVSSLGGRIVIWGAGARGRRIIKAIEQEFPAIEIKQVVDTYLVGECFSYPIVSPEKMTIEAVDAVVVATLPNKQDIRDLLRDKALTVI